MLYDKQKCRTAVSFVKAVVVVVLFVSKYFVEITGLGESWWASIVYIRLTCQLWDSRLVRSAHTAWVHRETKSGRVQNLDHRLQKCTMQATEPKFQDLPPFDRFCSRDSEYAPFQVRFDLTPRALFVADGDWNCQFVSVRLWRMGPAPPPANGTKTLESAKVLFRYQQLKSKEVISTEVLEFAW